jgi:capsular polysaccharide biosynthesis protein
MEQIYPEKIGSHDEEVDLLKLFRDLWAGKLLLIGIVSSVAIISVVVALLLPNEYRAEAVLAPNNHKGSGGLTSLASQYSGLASLAGLNVSNGTIDKTALGLEVLKSRKFLSDFIQRRNLWVPLMAATGWDPNTNELIIDSDLYDTESQRWNKDGQWSADFVPSIHEAQRALAGKLSVAQSSDTALVKVSIEHFSPFTAKQWVDWLIEDLNSTIMRQDVAEAEQAIQYLNRQVENTSLADLRSVFFSLIEEQTKTIMLAEVTDQYLFKTIDPAVAPDLKSKPRRSLIVVVATFFGLLLGAAVVLFRTWIKEEVEELAGAQ